MAVRRGMTLVELLVVVAIIALLLGIMLPTYGRIMEVVRETDCNNNLKLISQAVVSYLSSNRDVLPGNDANSGTYPNATVDDILPTPGATPATAMKWWCNKVYGYGTKNPRSYICPSDTDRAGRMPVQTTYGFNNTLTYSPALGGDGAVSLFNIRDTHRTALVGHCSDIIWEPAIVEGMITTPAYWPGVHLRRMDPYANVYTGRCGFVMASGSVERYYYNDALLIKNAENKYVLFHR